MLSSFTKDVIIITLTSDLYDAINQQNNRLILLEGEF